MSQPIRNRKIPSQFARGIPDEVKVLIKHPTGDTWYDTEAVRQVAEASLPFNIGNGRMSSFPIKGEALIAVFGLREGTLLHLKDRFLVDHDGRQCIAFYYDDEECILVGKHYRIIPKRPEQPTTKKSKNRAKIVV